MTIVVARKDHSGPSSVSLLVNSNQPQHYNHCDPGFSSRKLRILASPPWHQYTLMTLVLYQDNACCYTTKTAQEQPEEHGKELKMSTWPQDSPSPNLIHRRYW